MYQAKEIYPNEIYIIMYEYVLKISISSANEQIRNFPWEN